MLIYDRRRCRPLPGPEVRRRLGLAQRAKLAHLEQGGWQLMFVRSGTAYLTHGDRGPAVLTPDARLLMARSLRLRLDDVEAARAEVSARAAHATPEIPRSADIGPDRTSHAA